MLCRKASDSWVCAANAFSRKTFRTASYISKLVRGVKNFTSGKKILKQ